MQTQYDIVIVGGGGSGLAAAVSAAENRASILLLEKQDELGGTTGIAVGSFTANRTRMQAREGIVDSIDDHQEDAGRFPDPEIESCNNDPLRRFFLSHSADTLHWLMEMGLHFHGPSPEPPNRVPRMHNVVPGAKAYIATLQRRFVRDGGTIVCSAAVEKLISANDRVSGVVANIMGSTMRFEARRGVVLAAGDYANSSSLIREHKGDRYGAIEGINPRATGDGHRLAQSVGARLVNMDVTYGPEIRFVPPKGRTFNQLLPVSGPLAKLVGAAAGLAPKFLIDAMIRRLLVTWQHPEDALLDDGAILVNAKAERFCDETVWPDREIAIADQPDKVCYILLDESLIERYSEWPHFISTAPKIAYAYVDDYLKLRPDVAVSGSLESVASCRGLDGASMRRTVDASNEARDRKLAGERWVLLGPAKAYFTTTEGGAAINEQFQVLDADNKPIAGLYAIGQNGLGGQVLWGHGLHIAWAMTSGRLVGKQLS